MASRACLACGTVVGADRIRCALLHHRRHVTRSGSSDGAVGVRLDTFDRGGAIGGVHHPETSERLRWDDGELGPMTLSIPILAQGETPLTFGVAVGSASWLRC